MAPRGDPPRPPPVTGLPRGYPFMAVLGSPGPYRVPGPTLIRRCSGPLRCAGRLSGRREPGGGRSARSGPSLLVSLGVIGLGAVVCRGAVGLGVVVRHGAVGPVERLLVTRDGHQALPGSQVDQPDSHGLPARLLDLGR